MVKSSVWGWGRGAGVTIWVKRFGGAVGSCSNELSSKVLKVGWVGSRQYIAEDKLFSVLPLFVPVLHIS